MTTTVTLISRADVPTDAPARQAQQLLSHLGRKVDPVADSHRERFGHRDELVVSWTRRAQQGRR